MNRVTTLAAAFCMAASGALAQNATTQAGVEPRTPTGNETYSVRVIGANGVAYNCRPQIQNIAGQATRFCVNSTGATLAQGGLSAAAAGGGLMGAIVLAIVAGDGATTTTTTGATTSDMRLKTDIVHAGTAPGGLPLYHFRYLGDAQVYEGVMAQDVLKVAPEAVIQRRDGTYAVFYDRLGLTMRKVD